MKKLFALLLAAVMCLALVACGESGYTENKKPDQGNKQETTIDLTGNWAGVTNGYADLPVKMTVNKDGTGTWEESGATQAFTWEVKDNMLLVDRAPTSGCLEFAISSVDGKVELNFQNGIYVLTAAE